LVSKIGISHLDSVIDSLVAKGKASVNGDVFVINLKDIKVQKLLGSGHTLKKFEIVADLASPRAVEKIQKAGGKVILPKNE
jgi:large subunit ribosomal protein L15